MNLFDILILFAFTTIIVKIISTFFLEKRKTLKIQLVSNGKLPSYATDGSVCFDVYSRVAVVIKPNEIVQVPLGFKAEIPRGYELQVRSRSGLGSKGIIPALGIGTVDSDYRGEISAVLYNTTDKPYSVKFDDRVAQCCLVPKLKVNFKQIRKVSETVRGDKGFGSTGN